MAYQKGMVTSAELDRVITEGNLQILILLGMRSNGKSYAAKELTVKKAYEEKQQFIYLRRYKEDVADYLTEAYFADLDISGITKGKYSNVTVYRKAIYLSNIDEEGKVNRGVKIGDVRSLSEGTRYKSGAYPNTKYIVFEEFVTDGLYLSNEVEKLDQFISTVLRQNNGCVILIGNTISRICPYFREYELVGIPKQEKGTVDIYNKVVHDDVNGDYQTNVGVYLTGTIEGASKMFFRKNAAMINKGEWTTHDHPHRKLCDAEVVYRLVYIHDNNQFICELLSNYDNPLGMMWYIYPKTKAIKTGTRIVSRDNNDMDLATDVLWTSDFKTAVTPQEQQAFKLLLDGYCCYSDNLTGTEFIQCLKQDGIAIRGKS